MKAQLVPFVYEESASAQSRLQAFVRHSRERITALGSDLDFDADEWDASSFLRKKGSNASVTIVFDDWSCQRSRRSAPMSEPIKSFAKAYIRYQQAIRLCSAHAPQLRAFRGLEVAFSESEAQVDLCRLNADLLNRTAQLLSNRYAAASAYASGRELGRLVKFMVANGMLCEGLDWRNPNPRPGERLLRIGAQFDQVRRDKLPSQVALNSLAHIFRTASEPSDVLLVSIVAILCSAPDRMNEVLRLRVDCEVRETIKASGEQVYGLSWPTSKDGPPMVKWVVQSMAEVVQEALANIRSITAESRMIAAWYEDHPGQLYIRPEFEHLRSCVWVTTEEAGQLIFKEQRSQVSILQWLRLRRVNVFRRGRQYAVVKFKDLESALLQLMPPSFPYVDQRIGLRYSNALLTFMRSTFHASRSPYACVIDVVEHGDVHSRLGTREDRSIFTKFGFFEDDASPIKVTSHQFRHYLNTLAQAGGLSQLDIAKWSGRKDVRQNDVYDHVSDRDVIAQMQSALSHSRTEGVEVQRSSLTQARRESTPVARESFKELPLAGVHTTEFGYCVHDFAMLPCQLHEDCMNCDEHVCIKGDEVREANVRRHLCETKRLLEAAKKATADGEVAANRWVIHQTQVAARLEQLCMLLDDPSISHGAVIRLPAGSSESRLQQAKVKRIEGGLTL